MKDLKLTIGSLLSVSLGLSALVSTPTQAAVPSGVVSTKTLQTAIDYENTAGSIGQMLNEMEIFGSLKHEEKAGIEEYLASKKVALSAPLQSGKVVDHTMSWGSIRLTWQADGSVKTQDGRILHTMSGEAKDQMFIDTVQALNEKSLSSAWLRLFMPAAEAQPSSGVTITGQPVDPAIFAALGRTVAATLEYAVALPFCAVTALPVDAILSSIRQFETQGRVKCHDGHYELIGFERFDRRFDDDYRKHHTEGLWHSVLPPLDQAFNAVCTAPSERIGYDADTRRDYREVNPEVLNAAFPSGHPPRCTKRSAERLHRYLRAQAKIAEHEILAQNPSMQRPPPDEFADDSPSAEPPPLPMRSGRSQ